MLLPFRLAARGVAIVSSKVAAFRLDVFESLPAPDGDSGGGVNERARRFDAFSFFLLLVLGERAGSEEELNSDLIPLRILILPDLGVSREGGGGGEEGEERAWSDLLFLVFLLLGDGVASSNGLFFCGVSDLDCRFFPGDLDTLSRTGDFEDDLRPELFLRLEVDVGVPIPPTARGGVTDRLLRVGDRPDSLSFLLLFLEGLAAMLASFV